MSFLKPKTKIDENDTVIIYLSAKNMHAIDVTPTIINKKNEIIENIFQTSFGALKVKDLIGVEYGRKIILSKGWAYVLQANPELWTQTLPHRTQIIYTPDISMILFQLEIKPGATVIESGTGSGSLSHYFIRAVKPYGHLHTFDFHELRANQARDEFKKHGLQNYVTVYHRDVCENGFTEELNGKADAVFLDLPSPHTTIQHVLKALKLSGGRFCSFSPCIEQAQKCCEALQANGFTEIRSMELLQVEDTVKTKTVPIMDLEFLKQKVQCSLFTFLDSLSIIGYITRLLQHGHYFF
ncbi:tRNA (adenine(58)-N(1))-methyltransferase catalytic subunit TRMT61A isoform X2 [Condylostylus longicornis]|uniref:tRNA (adenine(58)-N(1))-methyltransferase catalytic subunit TRMT61A isoform X2 n=1 Tax=Condylostylus longicornis TaxID=2530218 RepID=UPI00244DFA6E|nr:tRNA (adenine(58)-N(1))-methyltransferase catalytic subunit TRMT61A isoform X2 [Condylostylus longicornis]